MNKHENRYIDRKDFLKQVGVGFGAILLSNCLQGCSANAIPDPNPGTTTGLDITIDISTAAYSNLQKNGGFVVIQDKKIIVARTLQDAWLAVSSECTHEATTIEYRQTTNDFLCPNHKSTFSNTGAVTTGPASKALQKYFTTFSVNSNTLRIFS